MSTRFRACLTPHLSFSALEHETPRGHLESSITLRKGFPEASASPFTVVKLRPRWPRIWKDFLALHSRQEGSAAEGGSKVGRWIPAGVLSQQRERRSERHRRPRRQARSRSDGGATGRFYQKAAASSSRLPTSAEAEPPPPASSCWRGSGVGTQHGLFSAPSAVFRRRPLGLNTGSTEIMCSLPPALQLGLSHGHLGAQLCNRTSCAAPPGLPL